jgi:hypothetical protein
MKRKTYFLITTHVLFLFHVAVSNELKICSIKSQYDECYIRDLNQNTDKMIVCDSNKRFSRLIIFPDIKLTLDNSFNLDKSNCSFNLLILSNFEKIDVSTSLIDSKVLSNILVYNSDFNFIFDKDLNKFKQNFFKSYYERSITFYNTVRYHLNISPFVFKDAYLNVLFVECLHLNLNRSH